MDKLLEFDVVGFINSIIGKIVAFGASLNTGYTLIAIVVTLFLAFFSYKLFKAMIIVGGGIGGYFFGAKVLPMFVEDLESPHMISGIICAIIFAVLAWVLHKVAIFLLGASSGFTLGSILAGKLVAEGTIDANLTIVVAIVCALIVGILFCSMFKPVYILTTAFGLSILAAMMIVSLILPTAENLMKISYVVGAIIGLFATITQFKTNDNKQQ